MSDFKYTECGLDNVIIQNMKIIIDDSGEETYSIKNVLALHKAISACILKQDHGISHKELRFLRTEISYTQAEFAKFIKKERITISRWEKGDRDIDGNAEAIIRLHVAEKLGIDLEMSIEDLIDKCTPTANNFFINIDGSDPDNYKRTAA